MAGFLYCFMGLKNAPTGDQLAAMKMDYLAGATFSQSAYLGREKIPGTGVICAVAQSDLAAGGSEPRVGYYPEKQRWEKIDEQLWIGWETNNPPGPADLVRRQVLDGHIVTLGDGHPWLIPCERYLPKTMVVNAKGEVTRVPLERFAPVRDLSELLREDFYTALAEQAEGKEAPSPKMTGAQQVKMATFFLGLNYRVGWMEANCLLLWNDETLRESLQAVLDVPSMWKIVAAQKEKKK